MSANERREERKSLARQRASILSSGFSGTALKVPESLKFWEAEAGTAVLEFIPYKVGKGNPVAQVPGTMYYERTYYLYRNVGADEKSYICASKTFGKPDYIQELRNKEARNPNADKEFLRSLNPQMKQLFLVYDHGAPDKGLQLWDFSAHNFGTVLDDRINGSAESKGWDFFYYPDETGFTLEVALKKEKFSGREYLKASAIDFTRRDDRTVKKVKELYEEVCTRGYCLDDFLVETPYEKLKKIYLMISDDVAPDEGSPHADSAHAEAPPAKRETPSAKREDLPFDPPGDSNLSPEQLQEEGEAAFRQGKKRADNPYKKGTLPYIEWSLGWEAEADAVPKQATAESLGISRDSVVRYKGESWRVVRVMDDGLSVNLMDSAGEDVIKGVPVAELSVKPNKPPVEKEEKPAERKSKETVSEGKVDLEDDWDKDWN